MNNFEISQSELIEAVQMWVDQKFKDPTPRVSHVGRKDGSYDDSAFVFVVVEMSSTQEQGA